jgi:hypothetical protein
MGLGEAGDRVRLINMASGEVPPGTEGTIDHVDCVNTRHVTWDNGSTLGLLEECDNWELIESNPIDPDHREPEVDEGTPYP